jgi:glycosyltransferase involved in cell wall biosynthesis
MSGRRVLIHGALAGGGIRTHVRHLIPELLAEGAELTLTSALNDWPASEVRALIDQGVRVLVIPFGRTRFAPLGKLQALATWPVRLPRTYDVLLCVGRGRMHRWMRRFVRPGGFTIYNEVSDCMRPSLGAAGVLTAMDGYIAMSETIARQMRGLTCGRPVQALPHIISGEPIAPPAPRAPIGGRELRIAYLGRVVPEKRADELVLQWPQILRYGAVAPARLDVYGGDPDGRELNRLRAWVRCTRLEDSVCLHGPYAPAELPGILARADVVALPSIWEGLPLVLVEAMLHGVPFVATDVGGTRDLTNPDVEVTAVDFPRFVEGLSRMAERLRTGRVDPLRLYRWADARYGYSAVAPRWRQAVLDPVRFFAPAAEFPSAATHP